MIGAAHMRRRIEIHPPRTACWRMKQVQCLPSSGGAAVKIIPATGRPTISRVHAEATGGPDGWAEA
jgi:hypothetical protein